MRRITVTLGGQPVVLRLPVPSKFAAAVQSLATEGDIAASERAYVGVLAAYAQDWTWGEDIDAAWEAMWDAGVSWSEVQEAVTAWVKAGNAALTGLAEAANREAATFPSPPAGNGDRGA